MLLGHFTLRAARKPPANYASEHATDIGEREDRLERGAYRDQDSDIERGRRDSERKAIRNVRVDDASRDPEGAEQAEHEAGDWAHPKSQAFRVRRVAVRSEGPNRTTRITRESTPRISAAMTVVAIRPTLMCI
jgi:signal recognition particle subunit SEC65